MNSRGLRRPMLSHPDTLRHSLTAGGHDSYAGALGTVALGAAVTAIPVIFHLAGQPVAIAICVLLGLVMSSAAIASVPIVLIIAYLFQNTFVALVSPHIATLDEFNTIRAYNFVLTATVWLVLFSGYWLERGSMHKRMRVLIDVTTGVLVLIGFYFTLGLAASAESAATYLRNIAAPILLFQIFALIAYRYPVPFIKPLVIVAVITAAYGFGELFAQQHLFSLINGDAYIELRVRQDHEAGVWVREMQETGRVMRNYLDTMTIDFFNTPLFTDLGLRFNRLLGPNFHSISYAYALSFLAMILTATGHWWWLVLLLPLLVIVGSKGAIIALLGTLAFVVLATYVRAFRNIGWYFATLVVYAAAGIVFGIRAQDYHVIGFIGGLRGFLSKSSGSGNRRRRQSVALGRILRLVAVAEFGPHRRRARKRCRRPAVSNGYRSSCDDRGVALDRPDALALLPAHRREPLRRSGVGNSGDHGERHLPGGSLVRAVGARDDERIRGTLAGCDIPCITRRCGDRYSGAPSARGDVIRAR